MLCKIKQRGIDFLFLHPSASKRGKFLTVRRSGVDCCVNGG